MSATDLPRRIDRDELAHVLEVAHRGRAHGSRTTNRYVAEAVIAYLKERK